MAHPIPTRSPEQLDAILRSGAGSLVDTPYAVLLVALAYQAKNAALLLQRNPLQKEIIFDQGSPVDCESNIATEALSRFLVSSGKLSQLDAHNASSLATARGVSLEEVLVERRLLAPTDLDRLKQQSLGRRLLEPFSWKSGTWELAFDVEPEQRAQRVKVPQLVLTGILKVETQETVDEALSAATGQFLALSDQPLFELTELRLSAEQQRVIEAAKSATRVSELLAQDGVDADDARRTLYALLLLGMVELSATAKRAAPMFELDNPFAAKTLGGTVPVVPVPAESPHPAFGHLLPSPGEGLRSEGAGKGLGAKAQEPSPSGGPPAPSADEVNALHAVLKQRDAFELLGVADSDGPLQFTRAYLAMAERFLPSRFDDPLRERAQDVFLASARAYADLIDPMRREALRSARAGRPMPRTVEAPRPTPAPAAPPPVTPPAAKATAGWHSDRATRKAAIIDPEQLYRAGCEAAEAGKLREALSSFELAAECDAQNGTYAAEVAYTRFRLQVSPAPTTLKMLKNAIRIDPRSGLAHLYAGKVAAVLGDRREAGNFLDRAAMLMPSDRRVVDALKSLR